MGPNPVPIRRLVARPRVPTLNEVGPNDVAAMMLPQVDAVHLGLPPLLARTDTVDQTAMYTDDDVYDWAAEDE